MADATERDPLSATPTPVPMPSLWLLLRVWLTLGAQSFGGGTATLFLIRRTVVEERRWVSPEDFTRDWSLCFIAPGINLLALTILVGRRIAGITGSIIALIGLLLPSVTITIVMTALYAGLQRVSLVQEAIRGIVPATIGLGLLLTLNMARPLVSASRHEGQGSLVVSVVVLAGTALAAVLWSLPVIAMLCGGGVICGSFMWWRVARRGEQS